MEFICFWCLFQIWSHDWQCCPDCYRNLAREGCSGTAGKMPPTGYVWQVLPSYLGAFQLSRFTIKRCHWFLFHFFSLVISKDFYVILSIATLAVAQNMRELYRLVLVDTPLAPYFSECITSEVQTISSCLACSYFSSFSCCLLPVRCFFSYSVYGVFDFDFILLSDTFLPFKDLDDMNIEIMRNTLYKAYLEDFYKFCQVSVELSIS